MRRSKHRLRVGKACGSPEEETAQLERKGVAKLFCRKENVSQSLKAEEEILDSRTASLHKGQPSFGNTVLLI